MTLDDFIPREMYGEMTPRELWEFMDEWYDMRMEFRINGKTWCWEELEIFGYMLQLELGDIG